VLRLERIWRLFLNQTMKISLVTVVATLKTMTVRTTAMTVANHGDDVSAAVIDRGYAEEDDIDEEVLAVSDDEADLEGDAAASFS
jgi:hypothetical protein